VGAQAAAAIVPAASRLKITSKNRKRRHTQEFDFMSSSYLLNAGWLFFAAWSVVVVVVSIKAFGRDFFPSRSSAPRPHPAPADRRAVRRA
jgi:hypothetical protein